MNTLKQSPQWVNWVRNAECGKIPKNSKTGGNAQSNNPSTWTDYKTAENQAANYDGIGFMFANGLCGIDIDGANTPERAKQAQEIIDHMKTYTEYSPSGNGYHIIFKCDITKIPQLDGKLNPSYYQKNPHNGVECYISGLTNRFFTYTGERIENGWEDIEERTEQLLTFLDKYMKKKNPPKQGNATEELQAIKPLENKNDILNIARKAKNGNKFIKLFDNGDTSDYNNDDSSADIALCNILAFYCQGDFYEINRLFRQSALYRKKWEREDYRTTTINKGIEICNNKFYKPKSIKPKKERQAIKVERHAEAVYINPFETPETRQRYDWNDIGVGNLFADTYINLCRYVPEAKAWYIYDGRVWKLDVGSVIVSQYAKTLTYYMLDCQKYIDNDQMTEAWVEFVAKRMKKPARDTMLADAATVHPVSILNFDKNPYIFNCQNCTLNLQNFTAHKHKPEDFLSKISNVVFDKDARCDRWTQFINEIMCEDTETARFLQKSLGYTLTGDTSEECFFILYGSTTRNGKGTSMETTLHMLGDYGRTAQPETIAQKQITHGGAPSEDIARLKGARFVNMSEPDKGLRLNSALVKQVTGGDTVTARFLHQNSFEYKPEYKLFINTNHLPRVSDDSIFASGRVKLIPFNRHFSENEQDKGLKTYFKQPENISGIFNWFIEGLKLLQSEKLKQPPAITNATNQYREDSDTVGLFIRECLIKIKYKKTLIKDVYTEYEKWCDGYGYSVLNKNNLTTELRRRGLKIERSDKSKTYLFDYGISISDNELL